MKTNHHINASTCATSRARNTSSMRFSTKLLAACAVSLFAFMLAAPEAEASLNSIRKAVDKTAGTAKQDNKAAEKPKESEAEPSAGTVTQTTATTATSTAAVSENKEPQVTLCPSLQKLGSSVEVRGEKKDMLFLKTTFKQSGIGGKAGGKSSSRSRDSKYLFIVRLMSDDEAAKGKARGEWYDHQTGAGDAWLTATAFGREHPNGDGYFGNWHPSWGPFLIVVATREECKTFFETINRHHWEQSSPLEKDRQRVELGDMTKEEYAKKYQKILEDAKANIWPKTLKWAEDL
jgi:hypothetical protein